MANRDDASRQVREGRGAPAGGDLPTTGGPGRTGVVSREGADMGEAAMGRSYDNFGGGAFAAGAEFAATGQVSGSEPAEDQRTPQAQVAGASGAGARTGRQSGEGIGGASGAPAGSVGSATAENPGQGMHGTERGTEGGVGRRGGGPTRL